MVLYSCGLVTVAGFPHNYLSKQNAEYEGTTLKFLESSTLASNFIAQTQP